MATVISTVCNEKPFRAQKHENICKLFYLCTANMNWKILWVFNKQEGNVAGWSLPSLSLSCGQEIYVCVLTMCKCWSIETELAEGQARVAFTSSCVRECISCSTCYIFPTGELRSNLGQQFNKLRSSEMPMVGISHGVYFHYWFEKSPDLMSC